CSSLAPTPTLQPKAPSPAAISYPIPLFAPVTSAIVFSLMTTSLAVLRAGTNTVSVLRRYPGGIDRPPAGTGLPWRRGVARVAVLRRRRRGTALRQGRRASGDSPAALVARHRP